MTIILAIDPGPDVCGFVRLSNRPMTIPKMCGGLSISWAEECSVPQVLAAIKHAGKSGHVIVEDITPLLPKRPDGRQAVIPQSVLDTAKVVGKVQLQAELSGAACTVLARRDVKRALSLPAVNDALVIAELKSRGWVKGTKKNPGPAYGIKGHCWQSLALAVAWMEMQTIANKGLTV